MSEESHYKLVSRLKPGRIIIPIILGLAVVAWFISREINSDILSKLHFTWKSVFWLIIAWCCMIGRDLGYMIRIRVLSENDLKWIQAFRVIMLWEFTSAITPSTVGGTAVAVVFIHKEGISVGRSTSIVLATSFLDELYFVIMFPLILLIVGGDILFTTSLQGTGITLLNNLIIVTIIGYTIILAWVLFVGYGLFIDPDKIRKVLIYIFRLPLLRRWKESAVRAGDDIVSSSHELKRKPFSFWLKAGTATFLSWTSRYWVINAILVAFLCCQRPFADICQAAGNMDHDDHQSDSRRQWFCRTYSRSLYYGCHTCRSCLYRRYCSCYCNNLENYQLLSLPDNRSINCTGLDPKKICQTLSKKEIVFIP